jgi:hypothetical protein
MEKIEPYGADEMREVMTRRRQQEQMRVREEKLRKQAYMGQLDIKVFEEELEASKSRKGGANPVVLSVDEEGSSISRVTDYKFTTNQNPLRFAATAKSAFIPIFSGTAAEKPVEELRCWNNHPLIHSRSYWMDCRLCGKSDIMDHYCYEGKCGVNLWPSAFFACAKCYDATMKARSDARRDPSQHPTFLRCLGSCSFTVQIPSAGGADPVTGRYLIAMEVRFEKLPVKGAVQSLLRLSLSDVSAGRSSRAGLYLNSAGVVSARPLIVTDTPKAHRIATRTWRRRDPR